MDFTSLVILPLRVALGPEAAAYALAAQGLNVQYGYAGLLNFGQVAFMAIGAYGTAIVAGETGSLVLGVLVGVSAAVLLGLLLGLPTLRLRQDYLAIVTIASAEILRFVLRSRGAEPLTGGVQGLFGFAGGFDELNPIPGGTYGIGNSFVFSNEKLWVMCIGWGLVLLVLVLLRIARSSPWGRVTRAIREDEDATRSLGKNVFSYKLQALTIGGFIASLAGILIALDRGATNPDFYVPNVTFFAWAVLILGGVGSNVGPIVGSMIFWFIISFTEQFIDGLGFSLDGQTIAAIRFALVGAGMMALMIFRPQGIFGNRQEVELAA